LIWIGVLLMGFAGYQLWGTNLAEASSQESLTNEFGDFLADNTTTTVAGTPTTVPSPTAPSFDPPPVVLPGAAVARIEIPKIGVDKIVVSGVGVGDLRRGPGHYTSTPMPGEPGNAGIAGHRTTYGAPFNQLDELSGGDEIIVTTRSGRFVYQVRTIDIVSPRDRSILQPTDDNRLTLTTCHPKFSARQRLVVVADLMSTPVPLGSTVQTTNTDTVVDIAPENEEQSTVDEPQTQLPAADTPDEVPSDAASTEQDQADIALSGDPGARLPALLWALVTLAIWTAGWYCGKRFRRLPAYAIALVPFLFALFEFYAQLALVLPGNVS
jgi:sortase A